MVGRGDNMDKIIESIDDRLKGAGSRKAQLNALCGVVKYVLGEMEDRIKAGGTDRKFINDICGVYTYDAKDSATKIDEIKTAADHVGRSMDSVIQESVILLENAGFVIKRPTEPNNNGPTPKKPKASASASASTSAKTPIANTEHKTPTKPKASASAKRTTRNSPKPKATPKATPKANAKATPKATPKAPVDPESGPEGDGSGGMVFHDPYAYPKGDYGHDSDSGSEADTEEDKVIKKVVPPPDCDDMAAAGAGRRSEIPLSITVFITALVILTNEEEGFGDLGAGDAISMIKHVFGESDTAVPSEKKLINKFNNTKHAKKWAQETAARTYIDKFSETLLELYQSISK